VQRNELNTINSNLRDVRENDALLFEYLYDSQGRRVKSHNHLTGVTTTYIYAGINVIQEITSSESIDYIYANGMRNSNKTGATVKYFHSDHLGSARLVTDSSGQPAFEGDYKPFGEEASATGSEKYAFTGQYNEAEIGLYYFGARWYDASLGRFISEDPLKGSMISPQSQNPYVYCMNNPLRYIDPSGMSDMNVNQGPNYYNYEDDRPAWLVVFEMREETSNIFDDIIDSYNDWYEYWHGEPFIDYTTNPYGDPYNLDIRLPDNQNPIGVHGYTSGPLAAGNYFLLYDSETKEKAFHVNLNFMGTFTTPGAGATLIDLGVCIDKFKAVTPVAGGSGSIPIGKTGANVVYEKAMYDELVDGIRTTSELYRGLGIEWGTGKKPSPGGGIYTDAGVNIIFGVDNEEGFYWRVYWKSHFQ
jgi:RHS repeat-associated protein